MTKNSWIKESEINSFFVDDDDLEKERKKSKWLKWFLNLIRKDEKMCLLKKMKREWKTEKKEKEKKKKLLTKKVRTFNWEYWWRRWWWWCLWLVWI